MDFVLQQVSGASCKSLRYNLCSCSCLFFPGKSYGPDTIDKLGHCSDGPAQIIKVSCHYRPFEMKLLISKSFFSCCCFCCYCCWGEEC